jgi:hypothetical protein
MLDHVVQLGVLDVGQGTGLGNDQLHEPRVVLHLDATAGQRQLARPRGPLEIVRGLVGLAQLPPGLRRIRNRLGDRAVVPDHRGVVLLLLRLFGHHQQVLQVVAEFQRVLVAFGDARNRPLGVFVVEPVLLGQLPGLDGWNRTRGPGARLLALLLLGLRGGREQLPPRDAHPCAEDERSNQASHEAGACFQSSEVTHDAGVYISGAIVA